MQSNTMVVGNASANVRLPPIHTLIGLTGPAVGPLGKSHQDRDEALLRHIAQRIDEHFARSRPAQNPAVNLELLDDTTPTGNHDSIAHTPTPASYLGTEIERCLSRADNKAEVRNCWVRVVDNLCQIVSLSVGNKRPRTSSMGGAQPPPSKKPRPQDANEKVRESSGQVPSVHQQLCRGPDCPLPQLTYPPPPPPPHHQCHGHQKPSHPPPSSLQASKTHASPVHPHHQAAAPRLIDSRYSTFDPFVTKAAFRVVVHDDESSTARPSSTGRVESRIGPQTLSNQDPDRQLSTIPFQLTYSQPRRQHARSDSQSLPSTHLGMKGPAIRKRLVPGEEKKAAKATKAFGRELGTPCLDMGQTASRALLPIVKGLYQPGRQSRRAPERRKDEQYVKKWSLGPVGQDTFCDNLYHHIESPARQRY